MTLERFPEKWIPVFRKKTRQNKEREHFSGSIEVENALGALDTGQLDLPRDVGSVEDVLSGRGVVQLYRRLAERMDAPADGGLNAAQIFSLAQDDTTASETLRVFSILLGRVAGDLALAAAAWGGVYLCGSVVKGWAAAGGAERFRPAFEAKGPMRGRMEKVYTGILTRDDTPLLGLAHLPIET